MKGIRLLKIWKESAREKNFVWELIFTTILFILSSALLTSFLTYNETRSGFTLYDPILNKIPSTDLTIFIFVLIYISVLLGLIILIKSPRQFLFAFQIYSLVLLVRLCMMYLLPLNPPTGIIPLKDPFVELFGTGETLLRDLFFSGHTATLFLFFLVVEKKLFKIIFLLCTVSVVTALLFQHVHYTIDIITAPLVVYASYRMVLLFKKKMKLIN